MEEEKESNLNKNSSQAFLNNFAKDGQQKLGEGTYGVVTKLFDKKRGKYIAMKKIKLDDQDDQGVPSTTLREISILQKLKHQNIIDLHEVKYLVADKKLLLVFELMDFDLKKFLDQNHPLPTNTVKSIMFQVLAGVAYCHSQRIFHRDLKPQNVLVNQQGSVKLADFGLSRQFPFPFTKFTKEIATLWYRAPELMLGEDSYGPGVDIWALGCIMAECLTNTPLFMGDSQIDMLFKMMHALGTPNDKTYIGLSKLPEYRLTFPKFKPISFGNLIPQLHNDKQGQDLIGQMLQFNPAKRLEAKELLQNAWFDDIRNQWR